MLSFLTLSLLLAPPDAHAGTYSLISYTVTPSSGNTATYTPYSSNCAGADSRSAFTHYGGGGPETFTALANDKITANFTWQPDNGDSVADPPPASAIVKQMTSVSWSGGNQGNAPPPTGDCDTGLPASVSNYTTGTLSKSRSATCYYAKSQPGSSFTADCTPTASSSGSSGAPGTGSYGNISVSYTASATPVTITPVGAVQDQSGNWDILIGQKCGPILAGIPSDCTVSNYQWRVSGSKFQTWTANNSSTAFTDGPGPLNGPSPPNVVPIVAGPSWYWYDAGNNTHVAETVSCTATVTPPAGQGSAFSVTASQTVNVYIPGWTAIGTAGTMRVSTSIPNVGNGSDYWLWAGGPGMAWQASVSSPLPGVFGTGTIELVQTYTPGLSYTTADSTVHNYSLNGQNGLDTNYPYDGGTSSFNTNDNPGLNLTATATAAVSGSLQDQFQDYLMYEPQGSSQFVPLANSSWATSGSAHIPATGWANFSGSAGTVSGGSFSQSNTFPSWTQNVGNGTGHF